MRPLFVFLACLAAACTAEGRTDTPAAREVREYAAVGPTVSIGVVEGASEYEWFEAQASVRLSDGRIVVVDAGTRELRYFDATGRFLAKAGGRGGGPGEFRWLRRIRHHTADSLLAVDWAEDRISVFDPAGRFIRNTTGAEVGADTRPLDAWLTGPFWVVGSPARVERRAVESALNGLPTPDGALPLRFVFPASDGRIWIREAEAALDSGSRWTVLDVRGTPVAVVWLPPRFELHEAGADFVLGRWRDADDIDFVNLYRLEARQAAALPRWLTATSVTGAPEGDHRHLADVAAALRRVVVAEEIHFADHGRYTERTASLTLDLPEDITVEVLTAGRVGWVAAAMHRALPVVCGMAVGTPTPLGWPEGDATCGAPFSQER